MRDAQLHAAQGLDGPAELLEMTRNQLIAFFQRGQRMKSGVHHLIAGLGTTAGRKRAAAFDEGEIAVRLIDEHGKSFSEEDLPDQ